MRYRSCFSMGSDKRELLQGELRGTVAHHKFHRLFLGRHTPLKYPFLTQKAFKQRVLFVTVYKPLQPQQPATPLSLEKEKS